MNKLGFEPKLHRQLDSGPFAGAWVAINVKDPNGPKETEEKTRIRAAGGIVLLPDPRTSPEMQQRVGMLAKMFGIGQKKA